MALMPGSPAIGKGGAVTTIAASITSTASIIPVANAAAIASTPGPYFILVDGEKMEVIGVNLTYNYLAVLRGVNGITASPKLNDPVYLFNDQRGDSRPIPAYIGAFQSNGTLPTVTTVTGIGPVAGSPTGNTEVVISGIDLAGATAVQFGTKAGTIVSASNNLILALSPAAGTGTVDVKVTAGNVTSAASPADRFTYQAAPTITALSSSSGLSAGGTGIILTGANLLGATAVNFGSHPANIVTDSANQMVVIIPAGAAGKAPITVITPFGKFTTSPASSFTYVAASTTISVTTSTDTLVHTGTSLRDAIVQASADAGKGVSDTIVFASNLKGATRTLNQGAVLDLSGKGTITINGSNVITISGNNNSGIFQIASGANVVLTGLTMLNGNAGGNNGGAIDNSGTLTLVNSTLSGNSASLGGALSNESGAVATVMGCTFASNYGSYLGGAISNQGTLTVTSSTLAGNSSYQGGAIVNGNHYGTGGTLTLGASTISGNSVTGHGGGVYMTNGNYDPKPSTLTLENTIIAGNTSDQSGPDVDVASGSVSGSFNLIGDGTGLTGITNGSSGNQVGTSGNRIDPLLSGLANNGGPTQTMAPLGGSPAIAAGGVITTLSAAITSASATTITVGNAALITQTNLPAGAGDVIVIDGEMMLVTAVSSNTLTVVRGYHGTKATTHKASASVFAGSDQRGLIAPTTTPDIGAFQTPTHLIVTVKPADQTVSAGQKATFTASARSGKVSVQWQVSTNGGKTWSNVPGATSKTVTTVSGVATTTTTLTLTTTAAMSGRRYRVAFTTSAGTLDTVSAMLTVTS
jgi:hypothetical protein